MPPLRIILLALAVLVGLWALDRVALWAERRGWLYWRKVKPTGNALGAMTLELQKIFESGKATHVIEAQQPSQEAPDPGSGGPPSRPQGSARLLPMAPPLSDLNLLLASLDPVLNPGVFVFASVPHGTDTGPLEPIATVCEAEGLTVVVLEATAQRHGLMPLYRAAWLTLRVHSELAAVGLTAAFAQALAAVGISCNVFAGAHHDHVFVPVDRAEDALAALRSLQRGQG